MSAVLEAPALASLLPDCVLRVRFAADAAERDAARALRRAVFCGEQGMFDGDDEDEIDAVALAITAVLSAPGLADQVVGTVRIHEKSPGVWMGSRLAVLREFRRSASVGSGLIRLAVGAARARGCHSFLAHVQSQNVALFERLHWVAKGDVVLRGRPHQMMQADLASYPPVADGASGFIVHGGGA
ncbi:MAG TPA: MSMEG_0567/Sll0786 family nitrogen starvation N-acetyltransferase [Janthinobacterium sp.]|jgi:putative N-acetyltransferase (TIGR04045 family)|nr:MSMEG_0567/Sll0786 family nitrogen starvation N-acetyltransferase [Janthinobacterium sp.]